MQKKVTAAIKVGQNEILLIDKTDKNAILARSFVN